MKTFFKRHLIGLFALVLTVTTMSFKMVEKSNVAPQWYPVAANGEIDPNGHNDAPTTNCNSTNTETVCAIFMEVNPLEPFPETLTDAENYHSVTGYRKRDN